MRVLAIAICATLNFVSTSFANPLDSPGTVYIDGVPCNLACQSYMQWSRQALKASQAPAKGDANVSAGTLPRQAVRKRISKRTVPALIVDAPVRKEIQALTGPPEPPPLPRPRIENAPPSKVETPEVPRERGPREQVVAALAVAELISKAQTPKAHSDGADEPNRSPVGDGNAAPSEHVGALVALLICRSDVRSASELEGLNIAIDASQSGVEEEVRSALAAAGVPDVQLSAADANALDRLLSGEAQAAVLRLVSPDAAEAFPEIKGFKVFRLSLASR